MVPSEIPDKLDPYDYDALESSHTAFYVTCTDILTGKPVYHQCKTLRGSEMKWMQASASMPLVSRIVKVDNKQMLDGGMSDSIPEAAFERLGYKKNIVVLTQPAGYSKKKNSLLPVMKIALKKYPALIHDMETRHIYYNRELARVETEAAEGKIMLIRPFKDLKVGRTEKDPAKIRQLYNLGRSDTLSQLKSIKEFYNM